MSDALLLNLSALIALLPASLVAQRKIAARDTVFWLVLGVAIACLLYTSPSPRD